LQDTECTFEQKLSRIAKQIEDFNDAMVHKKEQLHSQLLSTTEKETKVFHKNVQNIYTMMVKETKQQKTRFRDDIKQNVEQSIDIAAYYWYVDWFGITHKVL
jgi:hypothetical protein